MARPRKRDFLPEYFRQDKIPARPAEEPDAYDRADGAWHEYGGRTPTPPRTG